MASVNEEFNNQAAAFVQIIRDMIDAGHISEAKQLLDQYKVINPADGQIEELHRLIYDSGDSDEENSGTTRQLTDTVNGHNENNSPAFLDRTETIFIIKSLAMERTGFLTSLYYKVKLLEENLGYSSTILTYMHNLNLRKTEVWLKTSQGNSEIMSSATRIINVYEHYQKSYVPGLVNKAVFSRGSTYDGLRYERISDDKYMAKNGNEPVRMDVYSGYLGSLRMERHYKENKAVRDVYFDDWGYLNCVREYEDGELERISQGEDDTRFKLSYYTTSGELVIEAFFDKTINENEPYKLLLYDDTGKLVSEYGSNSELAAQYLTGKMDNAVKNGGDKFYLLSFEGGMEAETAGFLSKKQSGKNCAKICIIHSIFLNNAYEPDSGPQKFYKYICENPELYDGIIFLTNSAQRDFLSLYGDRRNTFVIGHPYPFSIVKAGFEKRDLRKAVVVARLAPEKQLGITLDIFAAVANILPDVKLEIYGTGPEKENLEAIIKELGMEKNIFLKGYTDNAIGAYQTAALSITTSMAEGYGLTIMESICNGCPAFSFDIKYGPSEIIKNGQTGFYFKRDDYTGFAQKIADYFNNPRKIREMSEACYADADRFSRERYLDKWLGMAETVYSRRIEQ